MATVQFAEKSPSLYDVRRRVLEIGNTFGSDLALSSLYRVIDSNICGISTSLHLLTAMLTTAVWFNSELIARIQHKLLNTVTPEYADLSVEALSHEVTCHALNNRCDLAISSLNAHFDWANAAHATNFVPLYLAATYACTIFDKKNLAVDFASLAYLNTYRNGHEDSRALSRFMLLNASRMANGKSINLKAQYDLEIHALETGTLKLIVENHHKLPVFAAGEELARDQPDLIRAERLLALAREIGCNENTSSNYAYTSTLGYLKLRQGKKTQARDSFEESKLFSNQANSTVDAVRAPLAKGLGIDVPARQRIYTPASYWTWWKLQHCANKAWTAIQQGNSGERVTG